MLGVDSCRCDGMEGVAPINGDLKGLVCRLLLGNGLREPEGVSSAFADLNKEAGVGVSGGCTEEKAFLAEENVVCGGDATWVEEGKPGETWSRSSCHFLILSSASRRAAADGTKSDFALSPVREGLLKAGMAVVAVLNPMNGVDTSGLNHAV